MKNHRSDIESEVRQALPELGDIRDETLRERVERAWCLGIERGGWKSIHDIPYAWNIHEVSNVEHVRGVTRIAVAAAEVQRNLHGAEPDLDILRAACLLHDVGKSYEYVPHVDDDVILEADGRYVSEEVPHSISGYALAHEVGCPLAVQRAIPHFLGEVPKRTLEAELLKAANSASSNAITQSAMGMSLKEWFDEYSPTS